jgi:hypothetical protein
LQDSHTAHRSPGLPLTASSPGKTACKPPVKISALITRFIVAHMVKEAKRSLSQIASRSLLGLSLTAEIGRLFWLVMKLCGSSPLGKNLSETTTV